MTPRRAGPEDVAELVRLINAAYRVEDFFIDGDRTNQRDVLARMAMPGAVFLVLDAAGGNALAGAVHVEITGERGYFGLLAVDPALQGRGLGRTLVQAAEEHSRSSGCLVLEIDVVNLRQELPPFYHGLGFTPAGTAPFPAREKLRQDAHLVVMTKPLQGAP